MPDRKYYLDTRKTYRDMVEAYIIMARDIAIEFGANPETADKETREFVRFEADIANVYYQIIFEI
jgi:predicted metalloendopeptidase